MKDETKCLHAWFYKSSPAASQGLFMFSLSNWILNRISGCLICTFPACPFTKPDKVNIVFPNPLPLILCSKVLLFFLICAFSLFRNRFLKSVSSIFSIFFFLIGSMQLFTMKVSQCKETGCLTTETYPLSLNIESSEADLVSDEGKHKRWRQFADDGETP